MVVEGKMFRITDLDPRVLQDWQVAEEAEKHMKTIFRLAEEAGIEGDELIPMGHHIGKVDFLKVLNRLEGRPNGRYIDVTAITPPRWGRGRARPSWGSCRGWPNGERR